MYGTGAGVTNPPSVDGGIAPILSPEAMPKPAARVTVQLNGYSTPAFGEVLYAGSAPGLINGLIQLNVRLPNFAPSPTLGPVGLSITIGDSPRENQATISVR